MTFKQFLKEAHVGGTLQDMARMFGLDDVADSMTGKELADDTPEEYFDPDDGSEKSGPEDGLEGYSDPRYPHVRRMPNYTGDEERELVARSHRTGLRQAIEEQVRRILEGTEGNPACAEVSKKARMPQYAEFEVSDYADFVDRYVQAFGLSDYAKSYGGNIGWEKEALSKRMENPEYQAKIERIRKERDRNVSKVPGYKQFRNKPSDPWGRGEVRYQTRALKKAGREFSKISAGLENDPSKPEEVTSSIDRLYKALPGLVAKGMEMFMSEIDNGMLYNRFLETLKGIRTPKEWMRDAYQRMTGGVEPYTDEPLTSKTTGNQTQRRELIDRRMEILRRPVTDADLRQYVQLPRNGGSGQETIWHTMGMKDTLMMNRLVNWLRPGFSGEVTDEIVYGMACDAFKIVKQYQMEHLSEFAKREADEVLKDRDYMQRASDAYGRFNASGEEAETERVARAFSGFPTASKHAMVRLLVANKIVPGRELLKYINGMESGEISPELKTALQNAVNSLSGVDESYVPVTEQRRFVPKGPVPPNGFPSRPGSTADFKTNPETGNIARRETGGAIHVNRRSIAKANYQSLLDTLFSDEGSSGGEYRSFGVGSKAGMAGPEKVVEILDAFLGLRTMEEGAVSLGGPGQAVFGEIKMRGRPNPNRGRLSTWFEDFIGMLNESDEESRSAFFADCAKMGFKVNPNSITDLNASEEDRKALGRAYLLYNWKMAGGGDIDINRLFVPDTNGSLNTLFASHQEFVPESFNASFNRKYIRLFEQMS